MKKTKEMEELKNKNTAELSREIEVLNKKLTEQKMDVAFRRQKNIKAIWQNRKRLARVWTILNQKVQEELEKQRQNKAAQ